MYDLSLKFSRHIGLHVSSDKLDYIAKIWTVLENFVFSVKHP